MPESLIRNKKPRRSLPLAYNLPKSLFSRDSLKIRLSAPKEERRCETRFNISTRLLIQSLSSLSSGQREHTISGESLNLCRSGLCFTSPAILLPNAILDIWIDNPDRPGNFFLGAEVIWTHPDAHQHGNTMCGIRFLDHRGTDLEAWFQFVELCSYDTRN